MALTTNMNNVYIHKGYDKYSILYIHAWSFSGHIFYNYHNNFIYIYHIYYDKIVSKVDEKYIIFKHELGHIFSTHEFTIKKGLSKRKFKNLSGCLLFLFTKITPPNMFLSVSRLFSYKYIALYNIKYAN